MKKYAKKNAKLTIDHIRSIHAKVKYSILLLNHRLEKLHYCQKVGGGRIMQISSLLIPEGRYSEVSTQD